MLCWDHLSFIRLLTLYVLVSAEFAVEVCSGHSMSSSRSLIKDTREPVIRYRHTKTNKYLCFSRSGRVRVWVSFFCAELSFTGLIWRIGNTTVK